MYQYHPTLNQQFSRSYYLIAMLSCFCNDISIRFTSLNHPGASELGGLGVGNCRRRSKTGGAVKNTPQPEAYGLRVVFAELSLLIYHGCEHEVILVRLNIIQNDPSSEPDAWRTACIPLTVFKPIKDGINNWLKIDIK
jgi:hypothetical protein